MSGDIRSNVMRFFIMFFPNQSNNAIFFILDDQKLGMIIPINYRTSEEKRIEYFYYALQCFDLAIKQYEENNPEFICDLDPPIPEGVNPIEEHIRKRKRELKNRTRELENRLSELENRSREFKSIHGGQMFISKKSSYRQSKRRVKKIKNNKKQNTANNICGNKYKKRYSKKHNNNLVTQIKTCKDNKKNKYATMKCRKIRKR